MYLRMSRRDGAQYQLLESYFRLSVYCVELRRTCPIRGLTDIEILMAEGIMPLLSNIAQWNVED